MRTQGLFAAAATAVLVAAVTACGSSPAPRSSSAILISFNDSSCGPAWHLASPGWHTFEITSGAENGAEVDLTNPANGAVYDELEDIGPGTTAPMSLDVGSGKYAFLCLVQDFEPMTGPTVTVGGHVAGTPAVLPVTYNDLYPLAKQYATYTESGLQVLARQTAKLAADVHAGRLAAAKRDWLTAHLQYETLGAAYDAFGSFDDEIDGRADAVGVNSPKWTGFYRLEYGLWHGQSVHELSGVADMLNGDVHKLLAWWPTQEIPLIDVGLRTHEILENALEFQLTGHDDYGSGTTLATTLANIQGTRYLLSLLHPLLAPRYPQLPEVYTGLNLLQSLIEEEHLRSGWWVAVSALPAATRQDIDAACSQVLQELAPIASIAEPRHTAHEL
ncbi:MAG TPA: EfeM/EfeO family lipoprotein [Streptosporangiaceae bacterium]|nr:EfeM/EfeO family lipoprotein [Streptosporangiaceae bacterium]